MELPDTDAGGAVGDVGVGTRTGRDNDSSLARRRRSSRPRTAAPSVRNQATPERPKYSPGGRAGPSATCWTTQAAVVASALRRACEPSCHHHLGRPGARNSPTPLAPACTATGSRRRPWARWARGGRRCPSRGSMAQPVGPPRRRRPQDRAGRSPGGAGAKRSPRPGPGPCPTARAAGRGRGPWPRPPRRPAPAPWSRRRRGPRARRPGGPGRSRWVTSAGGRGRRRWPGRRWWRPGSSSRRGSRWDPVELPGSGVSGRARRRRGHRRRGGPVPGRRGRCRPCR